MKLLVAAFFFSLFEPGTLEGPDQRLVLQPSEQMVIKKVGEHNSFYISCSGAQNIRWERRMGGGPQVNISAQPQDRVHSERSHVGGLDLVFRSIRQGDEGEYTCLQHDRPQVHVKFSLVVVQPISFGDTPTTQMVKLEESSHRLHCGVSGMPFPSVTWRAKGQNIRQNPEVTEWQVDSKYEVDGTDLVIRKMEREDEGGYLCKAVQNVYGPEGSIRYSDFREIVINLRIEQSPSWLDSGGHSEQFYGYVTGTANLTCQAEAEPPPTFHWLDAENQPISAGKVVSEQYKSVLMLPVVHHAVFGAYTCIAENTHGKLEKVVMLTEGAKPGTPNITPKKIYPDGINLFIEEPQAEMFLRIIGFQVEIKEINKTWQQVKFIKNFPLDTSSVYNLDGLEHNTFYHVRARSRNKAGLSDASNIIYLHTTGLSAYPRLGMSSAGKQSSSLALLAAVLTLCNTAQHLLTTFRNTAVLQ